MLILIYIFINWPDDDWHEWIYIKHYIFVTFCLQRLFPISYMVGSYPLLSQAPTHVEVELGCDNWKLQQDISQVSSCYKVKFFNEILCTVYF